MNKPLYFYLLIVGRLISGSGSFFNMVALNLFILLKTGSPTLTGLSMATRIVVGSVVSPYLGSLADRIDRKTGMILSDLILAVSMISIAIFPGDESLIIAIFIVQALLGVFQNFFMINFQAALPLLAPKGNLFSANSWLQIVNNITILLGGIGAAFIIDVVGYRWAFAVDGISYFASLVILLFLPVITQERHVQKARVVGEGFMPGVRFLLKTSPFIFILFFIRWLDGVGSGSHNVSMPVFGEIVDALHPNRVYGLLLATWSVGGGLGILWLNWFKKNRALNLEKIFIYGTLLMSILWIATFQSINPYIFLPIVFAAGIFDTLSIVSYSIILQKADDAIRGRVMALSTIAMTTGFGSGMALASYMAGFLTPAILVAFWHGIPIIFISGFLLFRKKRCQLAYTSQ